MDEILELTNQLATEIKNTPEAKEYLKNKQLIENDEFLRSMRKEIALLTKENKLKERDELLLKYNSHPLVNNFEVSREALMSLLNTIKDIIQ